MDKIDYLTCGYLKSDLFAVSVWIVFRNGNVMENRIFLFIKGEYYGA